MVEDPWQNVLSQNKAGSIIPKLALPVGAPSSPTYLTPMLIQKPAYLFVFSCPQSSCVPSEANDMGTRDLRIYVD